MTSKRAMSSDEIGRKRPQAAAIFSVGGGTEARTPKPSSNRRKGHKQLSAKQLDKIVKNLASVQRSVGHLRSDSVGSLSLLGEQIHESDLDVVILDEDGQRALENVGNDDAGPLAGHGDPTNVWLQRRGVDRSLIKGLGKGPDGIALARIAAKGSKRKKCAPLDSFMHESTFVFNPLIRRVPHQTPRKQADDFSKQEQSEQDLSEDMGHRPLQSAAKPSPARAAHEGVTQRAPVPPINAAILTASVEPLSCAPIELQEALLLEDLLHVLTGIEGQYVHFASIYSPDDAGSRLKGAKYSVDAGLAPSLRDLVTRILPLATHYTAIFAFVEAESSLEFGTVVHAMCAGVRDLLKEYEILVIQLEHQMASSSAFTLQRLWFYVHPTLRTFSLLHAFLSEIVHISHANMLDSDDDGAGESSHDDDEDDDDEDDEDDDQDKDEEKDGMSRRRMQLLALDDDTDDNYSNDGVIGGVVKGGEVLALLWERVVKMGGDETAHKLFATLLRRASQPYAHILLRWITTGDLSDTYEEFLVMENPKVTRASLEFDPTDEFWDRRYTLRDETVLENKKHERQQGFDVDPEDEVADEEVGVRGILTGGAKVPAFLEPWKRKILFAGKYLNVVRECGKTVPVASITGGLGRCDGDEINITTDAFFQDIEAAYQRANTALLSLLLDEYSIVPRLRSMKHYFFQSHADFFSSFLEAAGRELRKEVVADKVRDVTVMRLQSHLGMVLGSSNCVGYTDAYREDVRIQLASENAYDQLKRIAEVKGGIEAARAQARLARPRDKERIPLMELLQFDLSVKFPVSLVISKKNILRWQFLQRPIIHLKAAERSLCAVWSEHQEPAWRRMERGHPELQKWKMRIFRLRHRILFFVQQVLAYITAEVLEPNWRDLECKIEQATTVDQFMCDHFNFLNLCRKECMLTDLRFVEMMSKLMSVAAVFCENRVRFRDQLHMEHANWQRDMLESPHQIGSAKVSEDVKVFLHKLESHWEKRLSTFKDIVALLSTTDNPAALPLSYRLQSA